MGSIIVLTGEGKGKTSCALGMALRAIGHGFKVAFVQFIKGGWRYGELEAAKRLKPEFEIWPMGRGFIHVNPQNPDPQDVEAAQKAWQFAKSKIMSGQYFMVVLDEINYAISFGLLDVKDVIETLRQKPPQVHVVLTGRDAHPELLEMADLVTEMREIKHPFRQGVVSRKGIEY